MCLCAVAGVRARQEKVVFACCEDESYLSEKIKPLVGKQVQSPLAAGQQPPPQLDRGCLAQCRRVLSCTVYIR
jgi:hypothetical protein